MILTPYVSAGEYRFGKSQKEIQTEFGKAHEIIRDNIMNETYEHRDGIRLTFSKQLEVVQVSQNTEFRLGNHFPLSSDIAISQMLLEFDGKINKKKTYVLFEDIGLCLGGVLGKKIPDGKIALCFCRERLDFFRDFLDA